MSIPVHELWRKAIHFSGIFFLPVLLWDRSVFVALLASFMVAYLTVEVAARKGHRVPLLWTLTQKSKRPHELGRLSRGALCLVLAGILTPYLFGKNAAAIGLAQIFVADTAASFAGRIWGREPLLYTSKKTWIGSATFWVTATLVGLYFVPWQQAVLLGLTGAFIESIPLPEMDNLTVPLGVSTAAWIIGV